jgi:hypothetical protein
MQWTWALTNLPLDTPWILALDADQSLTVELVRTIGEFARNASDDIDGAYLCRRQVFMGRWIKHGGYYPKYLLKLFRRERVQVDSADRVDHHPPALHGPPDPTDAQRRAGGAPGG